MLYILLILSVATWLTRKNRKVSIGAAFLVLGAVIVFRFGLGADYFTYNFLYNELVLENVLNVSNLSSGLEVGYNLIAAIAKSVGVSFHVFFVILNLIALSFMLKWIYDTSENIAVSTILYFSMFFVVWNLSAIRQFLVIAIGLYYFLNKKVNLKLYVKLLIILLLTQIHFSAIFWVLILAVENIKFSRKTLIFVTFGAFLFSMLPLNNILSGLGSIPLLSKLTSYMVPNRLGIVTFKTLVRLAFSIGILVFYDLFSMKDKYYEKLARLALYGFIFYFLTAYFGVASERLAVYTFFGVIVLAPVIVDDFSRKNGIAKYAMVSIFCLAVGVYTVKELSTLKTQSEYRSDLYFAFPTVFDQRYEYFDSASSFIASEYAYGKTRESIFYAEANIDVESVVDISPNDKTLAVKYHDRYGVINQEGRFVVLPTTTERYTLIANHRVIHNDASVAFETLDGNRVSNPEYIEELTEQYNAQQTLVNQQEYDVEDLSPFEFILRKNLPTSYEIYVISAKRREIPFEYYEVQARINNVVRYFYYNENQFLITYFTSEYPQYYSMDGIIKIESSIFTYYFDKDSKLLWVESISGR